MVTASFFPIDIKDITRPVMIPDDDVACLMYYLYCVNAPVGSFILDNDLTDNKNYMWLPPACHAHVFGTASQLNLDKLMDKVIFRCDDIESGFRNRFCEVSIACIIIGQVQNVSRIMLSTFEWLDYYYTHPI